MRRLLATLIAVLLAADAAVLVTGAAESGGRRSGGPDADGPPVVVVPPEGQAEVSGSLSTLQATVERVAPIPTPLAVEVPERGQGGATIEGAVVDGERASIVWGAPAPLRLSGDGGALVPGRVTITVGSGVVWYLDGARHGFRPGRYRIDSPVAVGSAALARPQDSVVFEADERTTMVTRGGALVTGDPQPLALEGPGRLSAGGTFEVVASTGARTAVDLEFGPGPYVVELTPVAVGWEATMVLNGPLALS